MDDGGHAILALELVLVRLSSVLGVVVLLSPSNVSGTGLPSGW